MFRSLRGWLLLSLLAVPAMGLMVATARAEDPANAAQAAYCTGHGGTVQMRRPEYNTNNTDRLKLAEPRGFCTWTRKDTSRIYVFLNTLATTKPTLAALAYYAKAKNQQSCQGSPGSCYCTFVGGTDLFGGINAAGGGWVLASDKNDVVDACIFPDLSSIDSYALFYHSHNIIRGKNLDGVLAYPDPNAN